MSQRIHFDGVLIVGGGLAGLSAALACAPRRALVLAPPLGEHCATAWAQGGIAAAVGPGDSPEQHAADTIATGAGLVSPERALLLARSGPEVIRRLADLGAPFDRDGDGWVQGLEAAHSRARVVRVQGDGAGRAVMAAVARAARAAPHVLIRPAQALALLQDAGGRVRGVLADLDGVRVEITAAAVVLATGGLGGLYAVTTNPAALRGEGLAMAALAGAEIGDPEFVQFHPTALDVGRDPAPLATEALRGEGAVLTDAAGRSFMAALHPLGDLAPRDVVARAVAAHEHAFLDARAAIGERFPAIFPAVFEFCRQAGIDPRRQLMPVAPAAHYHMGGVDVDADGCSSTPGLYAAGECAASGVHGANRLASNSLLEAAAFGARAGAVAAESLTASGPVLRPEAPPELDPAGLSQLRSAMSRHAGVLRDAAGLGRLLQTIAELEGRHGRALPLVAARLVAAAALARRESRGAHFRSDFPAAAAIPTPTRLTLADLTLADLTLADRAPALPAAA